MTTPNQTTQTSCGRYNPNREPDEMMQVIASNWELLRRCAAFQAVANQWTASEEFRFQHVAERGVYKDNVYARCALDWMLSPDQRYSLAQFQMTNRLFFWEPEDNYGPISVTTNLGELSGGIKDGIDNLFKVTPDYDDVAALRCDQPWPATSTKFRAQFASIFNDDNLKEVALDESAQILVRIGNYLTKGEPITAEEQLALGRYLFQLGNQFHSLAQRFKIALIRKHQLISEDQIDRVLQKIKASFPYEPKTGKDSSSKRSFLGTPDQWDKYLAWEAHGENAYKAAAEFLPESLRDTPKAKRTHTHKKGALSRSDRQRDAAASVRRGVKIIQAWSLRIYPVRNLASSPLPSKSA